MRPARTSGLARLCAVAVISLCCSCASILSKSAYPVQVNSFPEQARVTVADTDGRVIYHGFTPAKLLLNGSGGYLQRARYRFTFEKEGYRNQSAELAAGLDGWYFLNLIHGGLIGMFLVDPLTGAMWTLDDRVFVTLGNPGEVALDRADGDEVLAHHAHSHE